MAALHRPRPADPTDEAASLIMRAFANSLPSLQGRTLHHTVGMSATEGPLDLCLTSRYFSTPGYPAAKKLDTNLANQLSAVEVFGITPWLTNTVASETQELMLKLAKQCGNAKIPAVFSAIPKLACANGTTLTTEVQHNYSLQLKALDPLKDQNMVYVLEPGVVASIVDGGVECRDQYKQLLIQSVTSLNTNKKAEIYLDVGFWAIRDTAKLTATAQLIKDIRATAGKDANMKIDGVALNTAGYQSTADAIELCKKLNAAAENVNCVIDTSRNNKPQAFEWCNPENMGIGHPPTMKTQDPLVKYFLWNKPPGESDGECPGGRTGAMVGPPAGEFFKEHFDMLWKNGWLNDNKVTDLNSALLKSLQMDHPPVTVASEETAPAATPTPATPGPTPTVMPPAIGGPGPASVRTPPMK